ncbi:MAG: hypothetical protein ABIP63_00160 [Thermoanaerobaculia bacterium]
MSEPSVDDLRLQLRQRGYLSHGVERWFAQDPWSSRTFWVELVALSAKAATLIALFALLPLSTVMVMRNHPLSAWETLVIALLYGAVSWIVAFALLLGLGLLLRGRPDLAIDTPRALLAISLSASAALTAPVAWWWLGFGTPATLPELVIGGALITLLFLVSTTVVSAALLSFSIYELQRVPAIHRTSRSVPMSAAAMILIALLFVPAWALQDRGGAEEPLQVVTAPGEARVAFVAVDGLTFELLRAHPSLLALFTAAGPVRSFAAGSAPERWASVGTGVPASLHGVRSVEGVRVVRGTHVLQSVSNGDVALRQLGETTRLTRRQPLPPTVRRRDYVWELFAHRGVPSLAVNWWTSAEAHGGGLDQVSQATVFAAAAVRGGSPETIALRVDAAAASTFLRAVDGHRPRLATVYLPSLDILLNRLSIDASSRLALSSRALEQVEGLLREMRGRGYAVILLGMPGEGQSGSASMAWTLTDPCCERGSADDVAPTLCALLGFPASRDMSGRSLVPENLPRLSSYGRRHIDTKPAPVDQEYYRSLRSLGYVR